MHDLSIIIVTYNSEKDIRNCLDSVKEAKGDLDIEVFVVDNNSQDKTVHVVRSEYNFVYLIVNDYNAGFPVANNQAIVLATGKYILLLNPDTIVNSDTLQVIATYMDRNRNCGICGPILVDGKGDITIEIHPNFFVDTLLGLCGFGWLVKKRLQPGQQKVVSGACLCFRQDLVREIGLLDETLFWAEDIDFCVRANKNGYYVYAVPTQVTHLVGQSSKSNLELYLEKQYTSKIKYLKKHAKIIEYWSYLPLFWLEVVVRYMKWKIIDVVTPSEESMVRNYAFKRLLYKMPLLFVKYARS